jgi:hypothetical protein
LAHGSLEDPGPETTSHLPITLVTNAVLGFGKFDSKPSFQPLSKTTSGVERSTLQAADSSQTSLILPPSHIFSCLVYPGSILIVFQLFFSHVTLADLFLTVPQQRIGLRIASSSLSTIAPRGRLNARRAQGNRIRRRRDRRYPRIAREFPQATLLAGLNSVGSSAFPHGGLQSL